MTSDDRFDEVLQEAAREHNSAPETPRAEMWAAIAAARGMPRAAAPVQAVANGGDRRPAVRVLPFAIRHRRVLGLVAGLAATLLVGVMIGRRTARTPAAAPPGQVVAGATTPAAADDASSDASSGGTGPVIPSPIKPSLALREGRAGSLPNGRAPSTGSLAAGPRATGQRGGASEAEALTPYRVATMQHLVATEALLVALRTDARAGRSDTTIATWAGDLLGTTRLLIDSPAAKDPQLKQLLEDLELVLAQISRLPGAHGEAGDLGIIDDAVRHRQIITRLRALSPET
jgi:hypothetical protein